MRVVRSGAATVVGVVRDREAADALANGPALRSAARRRARTRLSRRLVAGAEPASASYDTIAKVGQVPFGLDDVSESWLSTIFGDGVRIRSIEPLDEGVGFIGRTVRLRLAHRVGAGPTSVVVKVPGSGPARSVGLVHRMYEREVRFFRELAPLTGVPVPQCFAAEMDLDHERFALVLEDLAPARPGDQLVGATDDEAAAAVTTAATLHAQMWNHTLLRLGWVPSQVDVTAAMLGPAVEGYEEFAAAWSGVLTDDELALGERVVHGMSGLLDRLEGGPFTMAHGDYRLDNLLFRADGSVVVIDWQMYYRAPSGAADIALLLASSLTRDRRSKLMDTLIEQYVVEVRTLGVTQFDRNDFAASLGVAAAALILRCPVAHRIPSVTERAAEMRSRLFRGYWDIAAYTDLARLLD